MLKRLKIRFICINMAIVTVLLAVITGLFLYFTKRQLASDTVRMMQTLLTNPLQTADSGDSEDDISYSSSLSCFLFSISDSGLRVINYGYSDLPDRETLYELLDYVENARNTTGEIPGYTLRYYVSESLSYEYIVFADTSGEADSFHSMLLSCLGISAFSLILFFFASLFLARWSIRPIERAWEEQRQFVSDASHELKTPLAVIITNAELIGSAPCTDELHAQSAAAILTVSRQMRSLIEGMLELARTENGVPSDAAALVDFSALVSEELLLFEPLFFENSRSVTGQIDGDIHINGNDARLKQAVDILLDNAVKYSRENSGTAVTLRKQGRNSCLLTVTTLGNPLSEEDCKKIFRRFYRVDAARCRTGSYGLGLPIAERIVTGHHGKIQAKSKGDANTFSVWLPLARHTGAPDHK